jgi:hypothetical protein
MWPDCEVIPSSAKVKNEWIYNSTHQSAWHVVKLSTEMSLRDIYVYNEDNIQIDLEDVDWIEFV